MSFSRRVVLGFGLLMLVVTPTPASGEWWDLLYELSGPQMTGPVFHCKIDLAPSSPVDGGTPADRATRVCYESTIGFLPVPQRAAGWRRVWLNLGGAAYFSTRNEPNGQVFAVAAEPLVEFRSWSSKDNRVVLYHGAGGGVQRFFGDRFRPFNRFLFKTRPIGVSVSRFEVALNVRFYPTAFEDGDFGLGTPSGGDRPSEVVYGINFGIHLW